MFQTDLQIYSGLVTLSHQISAVILALTVATEWQQQAFPFLWSSVSPTLEWEGGERLRSYGPEAEPLSLFGSLTPETRCLVQETPGRQSHWAHFQYAWKCDSCLVKWCQSPLTWSPFQFMVQTESEDQDAQQAGQVDLRWGLWRPASCALPTLNVKIFKEKDMLVNSQVCHFQLCDWADHITFLSFSLLTYNFSEGIGILLLGGYLEHWHLERS